jgi:hypothetical protein
MRGSNAACILLWQVRRSLEVAESACLAACSLFLEGERQKLEGQIDTCVQALRQGLPGADVDEMIEQDPTILLFDVEPGGAYRS